MGGRENPQLKEMMLFIVAPPPSLAGGGVQIIWDRNTRDISMDIFLLINLLRMDDGWELNLEV